jgi:serine/threonine protein phosphatase PrpC
MRAESCSAAGSAGVNEDLALVGERWAVVLDGASRYLGVEIGCSHSVAWVTGRLGAHLRDGLERGAGSLTTALRDAIRATAGDHGPECDVGHPLALGATVAAARVVDGRVEWLVLGDAAAVVERVDGRVVATTDDRLERLPDPPVTDAEVRTYEPGYVAGWRNRPGGFWVASTVAEAADQALTGELPAGQVRRLLLCTDGITRLVERYRRTWADLVAIASARGLQALVDDVRLAERCDPDPRRWRGKRYDDATAVLVDSLDRDGSPVG